VVEIKNPEAALEVVDQLPDEYHLVFVGDGPEFESVKRSARSAHDFDRIHFTGEVSHERALQIIGFSDGLILTSNTEAYPTVVFEAICLGTPVYATPVGVLTELSEPEIALGTIEDLPTIISEDSRLSNIDSTEIPQKIDRYSIDQFSKTILDTIQ